MKDRKSWWHERKFALTSIALSLIELGAFILADLLIHYSLVNSEPSPSPGVRGARIYRVLAGVWLFGSPVTFIFTALTLGFESRRSLAVVAFLIFVVAIVICSLQMLV